MAICVVHGDVFVVLSVARECVMLVANTSILADEINDQLSLQMVLLFVGCVCLLSSVCVCVFVCGGGEVCV